MLSPPNCLIAISNEARVRVEFFSKIIPSVCPASGASASALPLGQPARAALRSIASLIIAAIASRAGIGQVQEMPGHAASGS